MKKFLLALTAVGVMQTAHAGSDVAAGIIGGLIVGNMIGQADHRHHHHHYPRYVYRDVTPITAVTPSQRAWNDYRVETSLPIMIGPGVCRREVNYPGTGWVIELYGCQPGLPPK